MITLDKEAAMFAQKLPSIHTLRQLADIDGPFPIKSKHVILAAERFWFSDDVIAFLKLFPPDEIFHNRDEFIERCKQLETALQGERWKPLTKLHHSR